MDFESLIRYKALSQRYTSANSGLVDHFIQQDGEAVEKQLGLKKVQFLVSAPLSALVAASACRNAAAPADSPSNSPSGPTTAGAPPTFGTGAGSGPEVTAATFAEAERLMQVTMTPAERQQAVKLAGATS